MFVILVFGTVADAIPGSSVPPTTPADTKFVKHYSSVMLKNVTITLEEEVARWARIRAAEFNTSVSRLVGGMLRERMHHESSYEEAMRTYLAQPGTPLRDPDQSLPARDELYYRLHFC